MRVHFVRKIRSSWLLEERSMIYLLLVVIIITIYSSVKRFSVPFDMACYICLLSLILSANPDIVNPSTVLY